MTKRVWPAPQRNQEPILKVLRSLLPEQAQILEVASGTGQHAHYFASAMPGWSWLPSDMDDENLASIQAWADDGPANLRAPIKLDVGGEWPIESVDAIVCANMIHISPIEASAALIEGASKLLRAGAPLITYGPYKIDGAHTAESNARFDASLRARNAAWGVRSTEELNVLAERCNLTLEAKTAMPANNFMLVFRAMNT